VHVAKIASCYVEVIRCILQIKISKWPFCLVRNHRSFSRLGDVLAKISEHFLVAAWQLAEF